MSDLRQCHKPGILLVLSRLTSARFLNDFHDWYDTEHGPARLQLGTSYFSNGYRYKTTDEVETWLAIYDMEDLARGTDPAYTSLRANRSQREQEVLRHKVDVLSRRFLQLERQTGTSSRPANTILTIQFEIASELRLQVSEWYYEKVFPVFDRQYTWSRSRLFRLVDGPGMSDGRDIYLGIHDFQTGVADMLQLACARVRAVFLTFGLVSSFPKIQSFVFHHEFKAQDYIPPKTSDGLRPRPSHDANDSKM